MSYLFSFLEENQTDDDGSHNHEQRVQPELYRPRLKRKDVQGKIAGCVQQDDSQRAVMVVEIAPGGKDREGNRLEDKQPKVNAKSHFDLVRPDNKEKWQMPEGMEDPDEERRLY